MNEHGRLILIQYGFVELELWNSASSFLFNMEFLWWADLFGNSIGLTEMCFDLGLFQPNTSSHLSSYRAYACIVVYNSLCFLLILPYILHR